MSIEFSASSIRAPRLSLGMTLLESLLVISIIIAGVLIGIQQYQKNVFDHHVREIENSVQILNQALEQYYESNCYVFLKNYTYYFIDPSANKTPVSSTALNLSQYVITPKLINNPFNLQTNGLNAYSYKIDTSSDFPTFEISTTFPPKFPLTLLNTLAGLLKPSFMDEKNKRLIWSTGPSNTQLTPVPLTPSLFYINALSTQLSSSAASYTATCAYWQYPKNRCTLTGDTTRCNYQNPP